MILATRSSSEGAAVVGGGRGARVGLGVTGLGLGVVLMISGWV